MLPADRSSSREQLLEQALEHTALREAWDKVRRNGGSAGADQVSLRRFERMLDANLATLANEVRGGAYRPGSPRRVHVTINRHHRQLDIFPVRDRVLQRAVLDQLTHLFEPRFLPSSFGYRPGRSLADAVDRIVRLRERGYAWVLDADIDNCFPSLDHALLFSFLEEEIDDEAMRQLIERWVAGIPKDGTRSAGKGISLGAPISPLLCNIYLHRLDEGLRRRRLLHVRYADDFVVLCRSEAHADSAYRAVEKLLHGLRLQYEPSKTRVTTFDQGFKFLGVWFEGDRYSYSSGDKQIEVSGRMPDWFDFPPEGYR